jgi:NADH:ubiquinone oxidoreductase subunit H
LAESGRSPYDFSEGESELVSGFNVEFGGVLFSFVFICEYGMLVLLGFVTSLVFVGGGLLLFKAFLFSFFFIWVRACFPRYRYDKLMGVAWKVFLPFSLGALIFVGGLFFLSFLEKILLMAFKANRF